MKSITIHNLDPDLVKRIEELSKEWDLSLNKTIEKLLRETTGLDQKPANPNKLDHLAGTWSKEEGAAFLKSVESFGEIDNELWK